MPVQLNLSKDEDISPQNQEALLQIASLIRLAESFRLGFVKCNQPIQCHKMVERLKEMLEGEENIITLNLKEPVPSLRRAALQDLESDSINAPGKMAIMVLGFERSIPSEGPSPALDELNQSRDNFPKSFFGPFLIWLPDYALTRLAREAPDFWGWRSGVFEFSPEHKMMDLAEKTILQGEEEDRLSLAEKIELASALEGLIRDYQELDRGEREDRALAAVLNRLGKIRYLLGDYGEARNLYQQSLEIAQELGDKSGVSRSLHNLGMLAQDTGDYDEARNLYQQSLEIAQELGDGSGVSKSLHKLGTLALFTGDYDEARNLYQQSLEISQELEDRSGVSKSLHQLGMLAQKTGDYDEARKLYQQSLEISQELSDKSVMSKSLHELGTLALLTGDYDEARNLYQQSLEIFQELGDRRGASSSLHNLGMIAQLTGNYTEARNLYQRSLEIRQLLGEKRNMSALLLNLGALAQDTGDYDEARKLYQQSLEIKHRLGDKSGVAITLAQLSLLEETEGHLERALERIKEAEAIFLELGSPKAAKARKDRERLERKISSVS
jgi:tetratricopeptide (TPR) repeat protein